ncbi:MAG TPA: PAS domain S-box protein, partial [bacterium]|nr:PAS domain S-box protein [bacterium]
GRPLHLEGRTMFPGGERWLDTWLVPLSGRDGSADRVLGISRDLTKRKRAEEALEENARRIRALEGNIPRAMIYQIVRAPDGVRRFTYVGEGAQTLYGCSPEEALADASLIYGRVHEEDRERLIAEEEAAHAAGGILSAEVRMRNPDGGIRWSLFRSQPRRLEDGSTCWDGVEVDITERKRAEQDVVELRRQLDLILAATRINIDIIDSEFNLRYVDPEWQKTYGDPRGRKCHEYFMGQKGMCEGCRIPEALGTKLVAVAEHDLPREGGRVIQVTTLPFQDARGEWLVAEVNVDITDRKRAEEALKESEVKYRTIFEQANDAIFLMDGHKFVDCNDRTLAVYGFSREQIIGQTPYRFSPPTQPDGRSSMDLAAEKIAAALAGSPQSFEWKHLRADGMPFDAEVSLSRVELGGREYIQAIVRDITDRKSSEAKLKEYSERLEQMVEERTRELDAARANLFAQAKLSAMGRMGAGIAHQLNSPLGGAMLILDVLREELKGEKHKEEMIDKAHGAMVHMRDIVECMLSLAAVKRRGRAARQMVDINGIIGRILDILTMEFNKREIRVISDLAEKLPGIEADEGELDQIFLNLMNNALDAMDRGGSLTIRTAIKDDGVEVEVADTGEGIPLDNVDKVFEPFFTTRVDRRGVGLGLSIAREIVDRYGGRIDVATELGKGTTFRIFVPKAGLAGRS